MLARNLLSAIIAVFVAAAAIASDSPPTTKPIRIVLVGDSTVASYAKPPADKPDLTGWGQVFGDFFNERVTVLNHAKSGRSTRSFIKEGLWKKALADNGDYIFIQFGHNDSHLKDGKPAVDAATDFQSYLRQYIDEARAAGAKPILVTPVARRTFKDGKIVTGLQQYADAMLKVGKEKSVPVIDLHAAAMRLFDRLGDAGSADMTASASDRTHFSRKGARVMARLVVEALPQAVPDLLPYLKALGINEAPRPGPSFAVVSDNQPPFPIQRVALESSQVNVLMADRAKRTGMLNFTVWGKPEGRAWVDKWQQPEDSFQWLVDAPEAGQYEVSVLAEGSAQAEAEITSDGGKLTFRLAKGWDKLTLPEPLPVPKGRSTITLRLLKPDKAKLKSLELVDMSTRADIQRRIQQLRTSTQWLRDAKYGLMFQWGGWGYPQHGPPKPWPKMIDDFNVDAFARMADDAGAGYVIWSVTWCSYHFPAPIKAIDRLAPGHTSQRDLVSDLADALAKRNIKLMLYYHEGHPDKDWWPKNWDYADTDRKKKFVNNLCEVMTEVGQRYGPKVAGWFLDDGMLYYPAPFERITKALKAGSPNRLVSYNSWILPRLTEFQEVYTGEGFMGSDATSLGSDGIFPTGPQKGLFAHGMFVLDGPDWGINHPDTKINKPCRTSRQAVELVRKASARGQTLSFNLLMYEDGSVSPDSLEVIRAVRKAIRGK